MADGSITFSTALDNSELERQLQRETAEIARAEKKLAQQRSARLPLVEQSAQVAANLDRAQETLAHMRSGTEFFTAAAVKEQEQAVQNLQKEYDRVQSKVDAYDAKIKLAEESLDRQKEHAGEIVQQLHKTASAGAAMGDAVNRADKYMSKFMAHIKGLARRVFVFSMVTAALRATKNWLTRVIKTNGEATSAVARLKGALLTLAQPLVNVIIPAFTDFVNILTRVVTAMASVMSALFGTTVDQSKQTAENLYEETDAIDKTGDAAKKAGKSLASFDEINQIGNKDEESGSGDIKPDFSNADGKGGIIGEMLDNAPGKVAAALVLAGITFIAIGAATASIKMVITGLLLVGAGLYVAEKGGVLDSWVDALGLNRVEEFVVIAIILGGIAMVAIGAATGNILLVIAGLIVIGLAVLYAKESGMMDDWANTLGLNRAASYITAALLIAGFALIVFGAIKGNVLMLIAGIALIAAGIYVGVESGALKSWADALGLDSVYSYITTAIQLAGIALIAIGAARGSLALVIAGGVILGLGIAGEVIGEERMAEWWERLKLTTVEQWISVTLLLVGIALVAIGAFMVNITMILAGAVLLGLGVYATGKDGRLADWVTALGLEKVAGVMTAALLLVGIACVVIGIIIHNIGIVFAGAALLGAGIAVGAQSGAFGDWAEALHLDDVAGKVTSAIMLAGIALISIGAAMLSLPLVLAGLALLGVGAIANYATGKSRSASKVVSTSATPQLQTARRAPSLASADIPHLARGAVIPPNREFLAVLGDQRSGNNIEAPESAIEAAVARGMNRAGNSGGSQTVVLQIGEQEFGRLVYRLNNQQSQRIGVTLGG